MFKADLHTHSTFSDGSLTPKELILEAKKRHLSALSITDHDNVDAFFEAEPIAKQEGIQLLQGLELSCELLSTSIHVLGYGFDLEMMQKLCHRFLELRAERNAKIIEKLQKKGIAIKLDDLEGSYSMALGRPHIAAKLVELGTVQSFQQAFEQYIGNDAPCYVSGHRPSVFEGIELIHEAGGKAILAHPHFMQNELILNELLLHPFDGIEAHYAYFSKAQCDYFVNIAKQKQWLITGGSDFHGPTKINQLGSYYTDEETFNLLLP
jgi:hypothetical protein